MVGALANHRVAVPAASRAIVQNGLVDRSFLEGAAFGQALSQALKRVKQDQRPCTANFHDCERKPFRWFTSVIQESELPLATTSRSRLWHRKATSSVTLPSIHFFQSRLKTFAHHHQTRHEGGGASKHNAWQAVLRTQSPSQPRARSQWRALGRKFSWLSFRSIVPYAPTAAFCPDFPFSGYSELAISFNRLPNRSCLADNTFGM